ncbi:MAG TPA: hypothetical protein VNN79_13445 [Actinomycetota bacterium]|nr:hypothetical protein [Actinomycetota bacterium]
MRRFVLLTLGLGIALVTFPGVALARGHGWTFLPASSFTLQACGTDVAYDVVSNKEYAKIVTEPDGSTVFVLVTGVLKIRLTNLATGRSFVVNASGTGHNAVISATGDFLFTSSGPSLILLTPEQVAETGLPEIFLNQGNMTILFGADGSAQLLGRTGHLVDECAQLAG